MKKVGIGTRVANFLVDTLLIFGLSYLVSMVWAFYSQYYGLYYLPFYIIFYAVLFIYYLLFELIFKRTPGKWLTMTKVVNRQGMKASFIQIFLRSLLRLTIIDCFFYPFFENTLHDHLSKTEVVEV